MTSVWSKFTGGFVSFFKNDLSQTTDLEASTMALHAFSAKTEEWASSLMGFYFAATIGIAVASVQVHAELPVMFHFLYLSILLGFFSLLLGEFMRFKSLLPNHLLRCLNLFFLVFAFFLAISIPFPLYFKVISFILFHVALFLILWSATIPAS